MFIPSPIPGKHGAAAWSGALESSVFPDVPGWSGIKSTVKHPTFAAIKIWAFAHLLVNGSHADVLLFGCFLAWAVAGRISMQHRKQRPVMGLPAAPYNDLIAVLTGLGIYVLFFVVIHRWMTGIPLTF